MNAGSIIVLVVIAALVGLALWRVRKKGIPCECGCHKKSCGKGCACGK